jgi:hypothetical protein
MIPTVTNFCPIKIQNLIGEIYQVVSNDEKTPYFQGSWKECCDYIKNVFLYELRKCLEESIPPNVMN